MFVKIDEKSANFDGIRQCASNVQMYKFSTFFALDPHRKVRLARRGPNRVGGADQEGLPQARAADAPGQGRARRGSQVHAAERGVPAQGCAKTVACENVAAEHAVTADEFAVRR